MQYLLYFIMFCFFSSKAPNFEDEIIFPPMNNKFFIKEALDQMIMPFDSRRLPSTVKYPPNYTLPKEDNWFDILQSNLTNFEENFTIFIQELLEKVHYLIFLKSSLIGFLEKSDIDEDQYEFVYEKMTADAINVSKTMTIKFFEDFFIQTDVDKQYIFHVFLAYLRTEITYFS